MGKPVDRDPSYMRAAHGTTKLITDYRALDIAKEGIKQHGEVLQQLSDSDEIRNADDYDDWEYGTEPIPHDHTWTKKNNH